MHQDIARGQFSNGQLKKGAGKAKCKACAGQGDGAPADEPKAAAVVEAG